MIFETFAYRKRLASREGQPDVYTYDKAPEHLRHQICMVLREGIGHFDDFGKYHVGRRGPNANLVWRDMDRVCLKELHSYLGYMRGERDLRNRFCNYIMQIDDIEDFLSAVEIGCLGLTTCKTSYPEDRGAVQSAGESLEEINKRFEQHAVGYQFENCRIIRVDSKTTHAEIIKPALQLLTAPVFAKVNDEFLGAHNHYRTGAYKDCVTAANRAFESMLKAICDTEKWPYDRGNGVSELITKVTNNGLFTHDFDKSFSSYVAMLKTGLPAVRNDAGAHGEGIAAAAVTAQIARFALNLTASNILFLGESYNALKAR